MESRLEALEQKLLASEQAHAYNDTRRAQDVMSRMFKLETTVRSGEGMVRTKYGNSQAIFTPTFCLLPPPLLPAPRARPPLLAPSPPSPDFRSHFPPSLCSYPGGTGAGRAGQAAGSRPGSPADRELAGGGGGAWAAVQTVGSKGDRSSSSHFSNHSPAQHKICSFSPASFDPSPPSLPLSCLPRPSLSLPPSLPPDPPGDPRRRDQPHEGRGRGQRILRGYAVGHRRRRGGGPDTEAG